MINDILISLVISLVLTLVFEMSFFFIVRAVTRKFDKKDLLLIMMANVITNPVVVLSYWLVTLYTNWNGVIVIAALEIVAVLVEGHIYDKYGRTFKHPYIFSITANAFSFGVGMLIQIII